jgi:biopolymer transport protein ExbD
MSEMNTTPLIDVMLVLLIMFIITIPVATHSLEFDIGPGAPTEVKVDPLRNRLEITPDSQLVWNGAGVTERELKTLLQQSASMPVEPELAFEPRGAASYALTARVTGLIKHAGITRFGFVGNEQFSEFDKSANAPAAK